MSNLCKEDIKEQACECNNSRRRSHCWRSHSLVSILQDNNNCEDDNCLIFLVLWMQSAACADNSF